MIVESQQDFDNFYNVWKSHDMIIIPVMIDSIRHVLHSENDLSFLFIKTVGYDSYYILPFQHNDCINLPDKQKTLDLLNASSTKKYTFDKKLLDSVYRFNNIIDIRVLHYIAHTESLDITAFYREHPSHVLLNRMYSETISNLNNALPILVFHEKLRSIADHLNTIITKHEGLVNETCFPFLNTTTIDQLGKIESNGLFVDPDILFDNFPNTARFVDGNYIYSQYNIYTATGRPANRFGQVNFAALNKENDERLAFTSRFGDKGGLVLLDYDAFHIHLIADLIGFSFPEGVSAHEFLGRQYFGKPEGEALTPDEYDESKKISFNILYGGIDISVSREIPFFAKTADFIEMLWFKYNRDNYIEMNISRRKFRKSDNDAMNKSKLFNYYLQNYETERNIQTIVKIHEFLENYKSKLVLYLYDGFMLDVHSDDGKEFLQKLRILIEDGNFKTKVYFGKDFKNLQKLTSFN